MSKPTHTTMHQFHMSSSVQAAFDQAAAMRQSAVEAQRMGLVTAEYVEQLTQAALTFRDAINDAHPIRLRQYVIPPAPVWNGSIPTL